MNESEAPILLIRGTISIESMKENLRNRAAELFKKLVLIYVIFFVVFNLALHLYYWYPALKYGYATIGDWFIDSWSWLLGSFAFWMYIGFIALYGLYLLVIRPRQAEKQLLRTDPDGIPASYAFYEDQLVVNIVSQTAEQTIRIRYADVQRKIKESALCISLVSVRKDRVSLFKTIMTPREMESVLALLRERCPQRRG